MRKRKIGKYGNAWVIKLNPIDIVDLKLKEGDEVDVEDMIKIKKEKGG